ncbi:MAG TPA: hypothetical protein VN739_03930 [Nitrososphaerales archaeon]|nr:hypothetical protein [Nitrososphaerales archaeon]
MILVPLTSVLYVLALASFTIAGYYGFRLTRLARKMKVMIMMTQDGPESIVGGIVILALSQAMNLVQSIVILQNLQFANFLDVTSVTLLVSSAVMFAIGFHKMYAVYLNERLKVKVHSALEELANEQEAEDWQSKLR